MKISENWLRASTDLAGISRAELLQKLTAAGLEVEDCQTIAPEFSGVVVAEIVECEKHPDADRLRVCKVNAGGELLQIVCGAPNARVGLKAPLATVGAVLPGGFKINVGKLRGVQSFGMLCSSTELGLPDAILGLPEIDGLLELPASAPAGVDIRNYLDLDDAVIELKMTPNRSDCLSVRGLTRELCALFNRKPLLSASEHTLTVSTDAPINIVVQAPEDCPLYLGQSVRGIDARAQTPAWMRERLVRSGLRSIHPVVDITNYVLLETGQPMHAFDLAKLSSQIVVRRAHGGEQIHLLNEQTISVDERFLLICDATDDSSRPLAVAGVMGGFDSRVTDSTQDIFFEAAHFTPAAIMGRARLLGLHTDSSHRFERGVDPNLPEIALARAVQLVLEICGGQAGAVCRAGQAASGQPSAEILLRRSRLDALLGLSVASERVEHILSDLGFAVRSEAAGWWVAPHSARFDIEIEEDLIEEIARVFGYDAIPTQLPSLRLTPLVNSESVRPEADLRRILSARDYQEAITFAFTSSVELQHFGLSGHPIKNPLSSDIDVMRPSLLPNLLGAVSQNRRHQLERVRLFELGVVFLQDGQHEPARIAAAAIGSALPEQWGNVERAVDFFDLKADLEALFGPRSALLSYERFVPPHTPEFLHPGRSAQVRLDGRQIGLIGELHPALASRLDIPGVLVFELDLAALRAQSLPKAKPLSKFQWARRDLAVVLDEAVHFSQLRDCVQRACGEKLLSLDCFDVYRGAGLPEGQKSLAINLILHDFSRTLSAEEVEQMMQVVIASIGTELGGVLRS